MPIDPAIAIGAALESRVVRWSFSDVLRYNLAVGAGFDPLSEKHLRFAYESNLQAIPTFVTAVPELNDVGMPRTVFPGIEVDLLKLVLGIQTLQILRPIPVNATTIVRERIANVFDKGSGALIARETNGYDLDGQQLWSTTMNMFAKGEGGFGGDRGPSFRQVFPARAPDLVVETSILPQQALLYRLCGDRNPMHADPAAARAQGFSFPFMHGLGIFGIIARVLIENLLDFDTSRFRCWSGRLTAPVRPGETLKTLIWSEGDRHWVRVLSTERDQIVFDDGLLET